MSELYEVHFRRGDRVETVTSTQPIQINHQDIDLPTVIIDMPKGFELVLNRWPERPMAARADE